jgi:hypothetical protein
MNKLDLKELVKKIDMNNINIKLIESNVNYLINIYNKIKKIWISLDDSIKNKKVIFKSSEYKNITNIIKRSILLRYSAFNDFIKNNRELVCYEYNNIKLYTFYAGRPTSVGDPLGLSYKHDTNNNISHNLDKIIKMMKISVCINKLYLEDDNIPRIIIWIPIPKNRDFHYNEINDKNLDKSYNNFGAFTVSGLTFGENPRITIITRYEEIEKLLIHELVHNFYIDGSIHHDKLHNIIKEYEEIKNKNEDNIIKNYTYEYSIYESYSELTSTYLILLFNNINEKPEKINDKLLSNIIIELIYSYNTIVNLAKLNKYNTWEDFIKCESFYGEICVYEYYYIKGLMYNNFIFKIYNKYEDFIILYNNIIKLIKYTKNDKLLIDIFNNFIKQENYKYMLLN